MARTVLDKVAAVGRTDSEFFGPLQAAGGSVEVLREGTRQAGAFEERTFVVPTGASVVLMSIINDKMMEDSTIRLRGLGLGDGRMMIMNTNGAGMAVATVRTIADHAIIVLTARQQMEKWEDLIRDAEARQMTNRTLLIKAPRKVPELQEMLHEVESHDRRY